ncbi:ABC transporter permease [Actinomycetota bacterium]
MRSIAPQAFSGTTSLARVHIHGRWKGLVAWLALLVGLVVAIASSIKELYGAEEARLLYEQSMGLSPAVAAFNGRGYDLSTLGGITAYEVGFMGQLLIPLVLVHLAIQLTRHEEDSGRTELIRAGRVGVLAPLAAAALVLLGLVVLFVALGAAGLVALDLPAQGSLAYVASLGAFGLGYGALALLVAEISGEARTAYGLSLALVLGTFLVRALVDGRGWDAVWLTPMGWVAEARPWGEVRWWPYAAYALLVTVALVLAMAVARHRDLGAGVIGAAPGPATAKAGLGTPLGFAWRFTRGAFVGWLLGLVFWGGSIGSLSSEMADLVAHNPSVAAALGVERPEYVFTVLAVLLTGIGAAALAVQGMTRLAAEESSGRAGLVLSARVSRQVVWGAWVAVLALEAVALLLVGSAALGVSTVWAMDDAGSFGPSLGAGLALVPAVLFVLAVAAVLHALTPRAVPAAWLLVGWAAVVGILGEALDLGERLRDLSPLHAVGQVPIEDPSAAAIVILSLATMLLAAAGLGLFRRRDLVAG